MCIGGTGDTVNFGTGHYTFTERSERVWIGQRAVRWGGRLERRAPILRRGASSSTCQGGSTALGNINFANNIQLGPISATSDPYHGVLLWQNGNDTNSVFLASAATSVNTYGGEIYVPNATISLYGFGNNISTGHIVANSLLFDFSFNLNVVIQ